MVDARLRAAWLGMMKFDDLSDTAWRVFTGALMWCVENGTDGLVPSRYLKYLHPDGEQPAAFDDLIAAAIWESTPAGYQLLGWATDLGQSTAEQIEKYRDEARERMRKRRQAAAKRAQDAREAAEKQDSDQTPTPASSSRVTGSDTPNVPMNVRTNVGENVGIGTATATATATANTKNQPPDKSNPRTDQRVSAWPARQPGSDRWYEPPDDLDYCRTCGGPLPCPKSDDPEHAAARVA